MASQTALLKIRSNGGKWRETFSLYLDMKAHGFQPNTYTFPLLLKPPPPLHIGKSIHADAAKRGFESDQYVINALISMYSKCRCISHARQLFEEIRKPDAVSWNATISSFFHAGYRHAALEIFEQMPQPNVVTWSAVISGCSQNGYFHDALLVFHRMRAEYTRDKDYPNSCLLPNSDTIAGVLSACVQLRDLRFGEQVHCLAVITSTCIESNVFVGSILIDLYGRCGFMDFAQRVFDAMVDKCVVAWSVLIAAYVDNECPSGAIEVFKEMVESSIEPNHITLTTVANAFTQFPRLLSAKELHCFISKRQEKPDIYISTALIDMYNKCKCPMYASRVFRKDDFYLHQDTTPMWNAMISGYVENDSLDHAWSTFCFLNRLPISGPKPNVVTMAVVLPLCAKYASICYGKEVHCHAIKTGLEKEVFVANGLLDMYAKCGKIQSAERLFDRMPSKNRISWTSIIDGYGMHGDGDSALRVFERMVREKDVKPDGVTFVALISACSHAGLIEEGLKYFKEMQQKYRVMPMEKHYASVVDLLARAGRINEAKELIETMPIKPSASLWGAMLSACRTHVHVSEAEFALKNLLELAPQEAGFQALMSNIYAESGRMDGAMQVRSAMSKKGVIKRRGCSWLETKDGIHGFVVGDVTSQQGQR